MQRIGNKELLKNHPFKVDEKIICNIWFTLNQASLDKIVESGGQPFTYYGRFGSIRIQRRKRKIRIVDGKPKLQIDVVKTIRLRKEGRLSSNKCVYKMYDSTYTFIWGGRSFHHQSCYKYKASRANGQASMVGAINKLWKFINENDTNYLKFPLEK